MQYLGACSIWVCDQRFFRGINILVFYYNCLLNVIIIWRSVGFVCVAGTKQQKVLVDVGYSVENVKIQNVNIYLFVRKCKQSVIYMSFLPIKLLNENMVFIPLPKFTGSNCIPIKL